MTNLSDEESKAIDDYLKNIQKSYAALQRHLTSAHINLFLPRILAECDQITALAKRIYDIGHDTERGLSSSLQKVLTDLIAPVKRYAQQGVSKGKDARLFSRAGDTGQAAAAKPASAPSNSH